MSQENKKKLYQQTLKSYRTTEIMTANKEAILLLLYEGLIRFLKQAVTAIDRKDTVEKSRLIGRGQDIVNELRATLNRKQGGDLAVSLDSLYGFVTDRLILANKDNDTEKLNEAINILTTLHEAWQQAINSTKTDKEVSENR